MQLNEATGATPFIHERTIVFGETDAARIVYTVRFFDFAVDAIDAFYGRILGINFYDLNMNYDLSSPFVHAGIDFRSALRPGEVLRTTVLLDRIGRSTLSFTLEGATACGRQSFVGKFIVSFIAPSRMKSVAMPSEIERRAKDYQKRCMAVLALAAAVDA